eukprot:2236065-Alexandrium_andersonii.AAC.1
MPGNPPAGTAGRALSWKVKYGSPLTHIGAQHQTSKPVQQPPAPNVAMDHAAPLGNGPAELPIPV